MIEIAKERFRGNPNVKYIIDDYTKHDFANKYDILILALSINHLSDEAKENFYKKSYTLLKTGGIIINPDQVYGETAYIEELNKNIWFDSIENSGLTNDEIQAGYERIKLDKEAKLDQQLSWLKESGFTDVSCVYKYYHFAVMFARKPV